MIVGIDEGPKINYFLDQNIKNKQKSDAQKSQSVLRNLFEILTYVLWKNDFKTESSRIYSSDHNRSNEMSGRATLTAAYKTKKLAHYLIYLLIDT